MWLTSFILYIHWQVYAEKLKELAPESKQEVLVLRDGFTGFQQQYKVITGQGFFFMSYLPSSLGGDMWPCSFGLFWPFYLFV